MSWMLVIGLGMPLCQMQCGGNDQFYNIVGIAVWVVHRILVLGRRLLLVCILAESTGCLWLVAVWMVFGTWMWGLVVGGIVLCHLKIALLCGFVCYHVLVVGGALFGWLCVVVVVCLLGCWWGFVVVCWAGLVSVDAFVLVR